MNRNKKGGMPEVTRATYKSVKKYDRKQFSDFCQIILRFKGTRMVVMPHYEFAHGIEVDADPELIELIIDYFEKKKDHYKQQLLEIGGIDEH